METSILCILFTYFVTSLQCPIVLSIIACLVAIFIVIAPVIYAPQIQFLYAFLFLVGGIVFYFPFVHFKLEIPGMCKYQVVRCI